VKNILSDIDFLQQLSSNSLLDIKRKLEIEEQNLRLIEQRRLESPSYSKSTEDFELSKSSEIYYKNIIIDAYKKRIKKDEIILSLNKEKNIWSDSFKFTLILEIENTKILLNEFDAQIDAYLELEKRLIETKNKIAKLEAALPHESDTEVKAVYRAKLDKLNKEFYRKDEEFQKFKNWVSLKIQLNHYEQIVIQIENNNFELEKYFNAIYGYRTNWDLLYTKGSIDTARKLFYLLSNVIKSRSFEFYELEKWWSRFYINKL
jgi:hypothetical protein